MTWLPGRRTQRFAHLLLRRYAHVRGCPAGVARVIARVARVARRCRSRSGRVTGLLELIVRAERRPTTTRARTGRGDGHVTAPAPRAAIAEQRATRDAHAERLLARRERVERLETAPRRPAVHGAIEGEVSSVTLPAARPVARVLRRDTSQSDPADAVERAMAPTQATWRVSPAPNAQTLTPAQVDRVADQVLHTIDRRLLAFRERRGRS
jgi:hypothetical protein